MHKQTKFKELSPILTARGASYIKRKIYRASWVIIIIYFENVHFLSKMFAHMKSLHTSVIHGAHSGCKPSTFMSSFTHSPSFPAPTPHPSTFLQVDTQSCNAPDAQTTSICHTSPHLLCTDIWDWNMGFSELLCRGWSHSSGDAPSLWLLEVGDQDGVLSVSECRKDRSWACSYTSFSPPKYHRLFDRPAWMHINMQTMSKPMYIVERRDQLTQWIAFKLFWMISIVGCNQIGWSSIQTKLNLSGLETDTSSRKLITNSSLPDSWESCSRIRWLTLELLWTGSWPCQRMLETSVARGSTIFVSCEQLIRRHLTDATAATLIHAFVLTRDRLLQRCPGRNHEATTEPASDGSQHCSLSTPANTEVRTNIVGDHRHPTLVACARSPHLQDMLSRLEQCCGCWSVIPTRTLHLVVGRLGTSTAFFNRFAPEGALLPLCHNTGDVPLRSPGPTS